MTRSIQSYRTLLVHTRPNRGHPRAWWLVVALLVAGLWSAARPMSQGPTLWPHGLGDLGRQRLAAAAQSSRAPVRELPSDAEMIAHFQAHRAEFEKLVALYQKHGRHGNLQRGQPEYQEYTALLKRTDLSHLSWDGEIWLSDPYAMETANRAKTKDRFHAYAQHGVMLRVDRLIASPRVRALVWKDYFYVPVVPRVEHGELWWPADDKGKIYRKARVLRSLDDYPPEWVRTPPKVDVGGCVYRRIEPQWFLRLCTGH